MTRTFNINTPFWKRMVTVDDAGIHEHRQGYPFVSIRWEELDSLSRECARSDREKRVLLRLTPDQHREFTECASRIWKERHPHRWQCNRERGRREADRTIYIWFPLLTLGPSAVFCLLLWFLGGPEFLRWPEGHRHELQEALQPHFQKMLRLTVFLILWNIAFWIWHGYRKRKEDQQGTNP